MPAFSTIHSPQTKVQREYGAIHVHQRTSQFGFQIQVQLETGVDSVLFALRTQSESSEIGQFCIRVDFNTGEIWDAANNTGLIGWLNQNLEELKSERAILPLRWEIEHHGGALIPRLQVGEEEWLYPAVPFLGDAYYVASVADDCNKVLKGHVWCQDRLSV